MPAQTEQWRVLAAHVLVRAACDATSNDPTQQQEALDWLNSESGRAVFDIFGLRITGAISAADLRVIKRNVYFNGNSGSVSQETFLAGHDAGGK